MDNVRLSFAIPKYRYQKGNFTCASDSAGILCCSKRRSSNTSRLPQTHSCNTEKFDFSCKIFYKGTKWLLLTHCFFLLSEISPLYFSVRFSTFKFMSIEYFIIIISLSIENWKITPGCFFLPKTPILDIVFKKNI